MSQPPVETRTAPLIELWRVLVQRRWIAVAIFGIAVLLAAVTTFLAVPIYRATVTIQIDRQAPEILSFNDVIGIDPAYAGYDAFYQTQYIVLQSKSVMRLAAERLDLANRPEFAGRRERPITRVMLWARSRLSDSSAPSTEEKRDPLAPAVAFLSAGTDIAPVRRSQLVEISFEDRNPALARDVANAISAAYLQFNYENLYGTTAIAREFLAKEVARGQQEISELEKKLQEYGTKSQILTVDSSAQDISQQALVALNGKLIEAKARLAVSESHWSAVQNAAPDSLPEVLASPLIATLKEQYARIERQHSQMTERFGPSWPALRQSQQELTQARERLELETNAIAAQVRGVSENDYVRMRTEVADLASQLERQKREVHRVNLDTIEFASLRAQIESKRKVLAELSSRQSQTAASERLRDTGTSNIRIVDAAETPRSPVRPRKLRGVLFGAIVGLFLGAAAAFFLDFVDNTVKDENDVQRIAGFAVLGHVPRFSSLRVVSGARVTGSPAGTVDIDAASHADPRSPFGEAFKSIRTSILLSSAEHAPRYILVTSCEPQDGKSTCSTNLAIVLAQLGKKVLLIDADLRRPRIHRTLGLDNEVGLSSVLSGNARACDALSETHIQGLSAIGSGPVPPNPSELLGAPALRAFLTELESSHRFDHVVVDSPPVGSVTDPVLLSAALDVTVVVVRAGKTTRDSLAHTAARLRQGRVCVAGAVLNDVTEHMGGYYYRRSYVPDRHDEVGTPPRARFPGRRRSGESARRTERA